MIIAEFVTGNFASAFIALVNCIDWVKRKRISVVDRILTALAVSRIGLMWTLVTSWFLKVFHPTACTKVINFTWIVWEINNHFNIWLATILSIFYFLKITNFSNFIFHYLKKRVNKVSLVIFLGGLVFLPFSYMMTPVYETKNIKGYLENVTGKPELKGGIYLSRRILFMLVKFLPFLMSLTCSLLLISSLISHLKKMKLQGKGFQDLSTKVHYLGQMLQYSNGSQDPSTKVHGKALKTVLSYPLLIAMYSLTVVMSNWSLTVFQDESVFLLSQTFATLYPSIHSCVLIWGNKTETGICGKQGAAEGKETFKKKSSIE
ncbi:taste receptor type 2 member 20-like [Octodon degus]|uniref:Taste receptor type 2 n=1 Tax=Octodon degus TaxID=10160 RepID=A0A6P3V9X8_OCTDE|nr:taste receptor type 2 member 20-like [Octodon degus]